LHQFPSSPLFVLPVLDGVHLRVFFSLKSLARVLLPYISDRGALYGTFPARGPSGLSEPIPAPKKLLIEFSSPNIGTEFHGAHLRSTILGTHIAALHEQMGWEVTRINYIGDWGKQIGLLAAGWARFGSEDAFVADPLRHLLDLYKLIEGPFKAELDARGRIRDEGGDPVEVEARMAEIETQGLHAERDRWFKRLEDRDEEAVALWQRFRDVSIEEYTKQYARLGVVFDEYTGESQVSAGSISRVEAALKEKGVYEESHDAWIIDFRKHGGTKGMDKGTLRFRTGTTTYLLRDIAAVLDRAEKYNFDKMIYVVSADQDMHFHRVFRALELMGRADLRAKLEHVHFGKVQELQLVSGGHAQLLRDYLNLSHNTASELLKVDIGKAAPLGDADAVADMIGTSALIVQCLHGRRVGQFAINAMRAATFEGETGPYLQYWHARLCEMLKSVAGPAMIDYSAVDREDYGDLLRLLAQYPDFVKTAFRNLEPGGVLTYLFRLMNEFLICFDHEEEVPEISAGDSLVYGAVRQVLENGLKVLGVPVCGR
jgi:arginyl-tRNA synthetase